jgi:hypothetical protein
VIFVVIHEFFEEIWLRDEVMVERISVITADRRTHAEQVGLQEAFKKPRDTLW